MNTRRQFHFRLLDQPQLNKQEARKISKKFTLFNIELSNLLSLSTLSFVTKLRKDKMKKCLIYEFTRYYRASWILYSSVYIFPLKIEHKCTFFSSSFENPQGRPQLKKSPKFQLLAEIFQIPSPPSLKKGPTDENVGISYLIVIIKFSFFSKF